MLNFRQLAWAALLAATIGLGAQAGPTLPPPPETESTVVPAKLGLSSMSKDERKNLWRMVEEYATVDALQSFCGKKLNLQRRAWRAVAACVEVKSLRRVLAVFRKKKKKYLKAWEDLHGEPEKKEAVCKQFGGKLKEYARIMRSQISEAATMCRNCFFC